MATTINMLGNYQFRNWLGLAPGVLMESTEVLSSPSTDYQAVRTLGIRSEQFTRESIVDMPNIPFARAVLTGYNTLIGAGSQQLIWNGWNFDSENLRAVVLGVELLELQQKVFICGALTPGNRVDLRVKWTFLLVPTG